MNVFREPLSLYLFERAFVNCVQSCNFSIPKKNEDLALGEWESGRVVDHHILSNHCGLGTGVGPVQT